MALSLAFHIVFSCIGMVMPWLMTVSHYKWLKSGDEGYFRLTKAWSKGVAIFFVTGAVSGTVLSFEMGLLWPSFMEAAGPIFGMPFSLEGTAFFVEAIALGLYLYGWKRMPRWVHWWSGVVVGLSGVASGVLVVAANGWMNSPTGFVFDAASQTFSQIDPVAAMLNPAWFHQAVHMTLAAFVATGFAVAGIHAWLLLRGRNVSFHRRAVRIALVFGAVAALLQPLSGHQSADAVAALQPAKLAAMEAHYETGPADMILGGIPDEANETVDYAIRLPGMLSWLIHFDTEEPVVGLDQFATADRPNVTVVHLAYQAMVGMGMFLAFLGVLYFALNRSKTKALMRSWYLKALVLGAPMGFLAVEAGWTVTEVGRQPWIIYDVMRTSDAVTSMPGIQYSFYVFTAVYIMLSILVTLLMVRQVRMIPVLYDTDPAHSPNLSTH